MEDPVDHLMQYQTAMQFQGASDAVLCRGFAVTLKKGAREWFQALKPKSISSFSELAEQFIARFVSSRKPKRPSTSLFQVKQQRNETLREYVTRFREELSRIQDLEEGIAVAAFSSGIRSGRFCFSLSKNMPRTLEGLFSKAEKYMTAEEFMTARQEGEPPNTEKRKREGKTTLVPNNEERRKIRGFNGSAPMFSSRPRYESYMSLNTPRARILNEIRGTNMLRQPQPTGGNPELRNQIKFCEYHQDHGHWTSECQQLKDEIERLIRIGKLRRYAADRCRPYEGGRRNNEQRDRDPPRGNPQQQQVAGVIQTILGGLASGGSSSTGRKNYSRGGQVYHVKGLGSKVDETLTFGEGDVKGVSFPHDDAVVITTTIANYAVKRVLVDSGSSADIIFSDAFQKLKIGKERLQSCGSLIGFNGTSEQPEGMITLPLTVGEGPKSKTVMVSWIIVKAPSPYNVILGRPTLNALGAVVSTPHLVMKFPTPYGVGVVKGDQLAARQCYLMGLKTKVPMA